jgi:hypothetical protein
MAKQYDETNSGALFGAEHMKILRQGKVNWEGEEMYITLNQVTTKKGNVVFEVYQKVGAIFVNDNKRTDNDPDMSGNVEDRILGEYRLSGWKKTSKDGLPYTSVAFRKKDGDYKKQPAAKASHMVDDTEPDEEAIPF